MTTQRENEARQFVELAALLRSTPAFRQPEGKPLVYGYVRNSHRRLAVVDHCAEALAEWCEQEGWQLGAVFRDVAVSSNATAAQRPGFTALLDVLRLPVVFGAVVVDPVHLSRRVALACQLAQEIRATGARLLVMNGAVPMPTDIRSVTGFGEGGS